jgi:nucleotide-binding universal stress UspA family protein
MYTRILVGADGSEHAERALRHAAGLAKALNAALHIVHVIDMGWLPAAPELGLDLTKFSATRRARGEAVLALAAQAARAAGAAAETRLIETETPNQPPAAALVEEAVSWQADLIVLGAHGRLGVERLLLGSMADGVARRSGIPVLLVR